jgi:hypothetical protein
MEMSRSRHASFVGQIDSFHATTKKWGRAMSEVSTFTFPVHTGEVAFLLWLLIMGAKEQIVTSPVS